MYEELMMDGSVPLTNTSDGNVQFQSSPVTINELPQVRDAADEFSRHWVEDMQITPAYVAIALGEQALTLMLSHYEELGAGILIAALESCLAESLPPNPN